MEQPLVSPTPPKKPQHALLTFPQALNFVIDGKRVTRVDWGNVEEYGFLKDGWLSIRTKGEIHTWLVSEGDLLAIDWYVLPEGN